MSNKVNGNTGGIRTVLLEQIQTLYDLRLGQDVFASREMLERIALYTQAIGREISVYITRNGMVVDVSIGDHATVSMPSMRVVRNEERLCGVRCIHSHPNGNGMLSNVDLGTLRSMKLDSMAAVGVMDGEPTTFYAAYLNEQDAEQDVLVYGPLRPDKLPQSALMREIYAADARLRSSTHQVTELAPERAILVGLESNAGYDTLQELAELASTAGADVVGRMLQRRAGIDNATYIGSGKAEELSLLGSAKQADLFIFDDELSAIQLRNLETLLGRPVIDRTTLILDIFAARAQSREGKLQVELAQLKYRLPRLLGMGTSLSRLGGGIGTRGPGEKKLEIDRRRIRRRIFELEQELGQIERQRALRRERRQKNTIPLIALVGYTNAGKSTLLNAICGSDVLCEDKLFATLDPVVRRMELPNGTEAIFSDTVGFINKLPHELVKAFHSTLEEVSQADLILHVIDSTCPHYDVHVQVVEDVLSQLGASDKPCIYVYNKVDCETAQPARRGKWAHISAKTGEGLDALFGQIETLLNASQMKVQLHVPYACYDAIAPVRSAGRILEESHDEFGTAFVLLLEQDDLGRLKSQLGGKLSDQGQPSPTQCSLRILE